MGSEVAHSELTCPSERRLCDADRSKSLVDSASDTDEMVVSVIDQVVHSMAVELSRVTALMETVGPSQICLGIRPVAAHGNPRHKSMIQL